jgi:hypothetical protein
MTWLALSRLDETFAEGPGSPGLLLEARFDIQGPEPVHFRGLLCWRGELVLWPNDTQKERERRLEVIL